MPEKRAIFQDVGSDARGPRPPTPGIIDEDMLKGRGAVRLWLAVLFALLVIMIAVGGLTRLTDSGLSIPEWAPFAGALPPLSEAAWAEAFTKYQAIPEYQLQNTSMTLDGFKSIFWWEWGHRQLGRVIGLVWALGFVGFMVTGRMPRGWTGRFLVLGVLGGIQGALGWWMVHSGLTGRMVDVASYRLALHLGLAFVILGLIANYIFLLGRTDAALLLVRRSREGRLVSIATGMMHLAFLQILLGALVAGIDAGRSFPTWPLMGETYFPADAFYVPGGGAAWLAFFENQGLVQFMHRTVGYLLLIYGVYAWGRGRSSAQKATSRAFGWMMVALIVQLCLGIATVLYMAPLSLALAHQLGAVLLWVAILHARHLSAYPKIQSIRRTK